MSIATEISRLTTLRNNIRTKLINLGIISNSSATLSDCYTGLNGVTKQTASGNTTLNSSTTTKSFAAGYYPNAHGATHAVVNIPDPTITVSGNGLITASGSWTAGFTSDTSYSGTSQLVPCPARVWVPTTTDQSISPPGFLTGVQTIKGDVNLVAANIKSGVSIFGVSGTYSGGTDTSDATATAAEIKTGKTAYISSGKVTGTYVPYLEFTNKSVAANNWSSNNTYTNYPYRASIACSGATSDMFPYVEFSSDDAGNGYFCPHAQSYSGGVYIYALEARSVTVTKITFYKRS